MVGGMPFGIGAAELVILLLVALLVFGPKRLPEMGRSLGRGMREFKESISTINAPLEAPAETTPEAETAAPPSRSTAS
jgi:sec-independent protein translocase protein TatA